MRTRLALWQSHTARKIGTSGDALRPHPGFARGATELLEPLSEAAGPLPQGNIDTPTIQQNVCAPSIHSIAPVFLRWQAAATPVTLRRRAGPGSGPADCAASSRRTSPGTRPGTGPGTGGLRLAPSGPAQGPPRRARPAGWPRGPADCAPASGEFWARRGAAILRWQCAQP